MDKLKRTLMVGLPVSALATFSAFAVDETGGATSAMAIIEAQITQLTGDAGKIIAGALGISVLFFGAKFLWSKFKSMAK